MNFKPESEEEARAYRILAEFEAMIEKELGPLDNDLKHEARLMVLKKLLDRCTDEQLRDIRQKLAEHPISGKADLGSLDLVDGAIHLRLIAKS